MNGVSAVAVVSAICLRRTEAEVPAVIFLRHDTQLLRRFGGALPGLHEVFAGQNAAVRAAGQGPLVTLNLHEHGILGAEQKDKAFLNEESAKIFAESLREAQKQLQYTEDLCITIVKQD